MKKAPNSQPDTSGEALKSDLTGQSFGDLTVVNLSHTGGHGAKFWNCLCLCGSTRTARASELFSGLCRTCGTHKSRSQLSWEDQQSVNLRKFPKGLGPGSRLYRIWGNMRSRCGNPKFPKYKDYGARGIRVCDEWESFGPFMEWSVANGYDENLTIDRVDNYKGYEPGNCRWATTEVQDKNRRTPRKSFAAFGEVKTVGDWSRDPRCKVGYRALAHRALKGGVGELMLTEPVTIGRPVGGPAWKVAHG